MRRTGIVGLLVALALVPAQAQQAGCLEKTIPVTIASNDGSAVPELTVANLQGTYYKRRVTVKTVDLAKNPPRVILLIDASGSMQGHVNAIGEAAERILESLPLQSEVGLVFFQSAIIPVALPTSDRKSLLLQVQALRNNRRSFKGKTALRNAVLAGVKMLGTPAFGDSLYLISDGGDNQSKTQESTMERELEKSGIRLFALVLGRGMARVTPEEISGPNLLKSAADNTGGTVIEVGVVPHIEGSGASGAMTDDIPVDFFKKDGPPTQLGQDLRQQICQILNLYQVDITLPLPVDKPRDLKLELTGFDKSRQRTLQLAYPHVTFPCS